MQELSTTQSLLWAIVACLILVAFFPGTKAALQRSQDVPSDWLTVLLLMGCIVAFVFFLITMV